MDSGTQAAPGRRPTVISLCCGAGGMDLGFAAAGFRGVYACDFNADAVATYRRNLGDHVEQADLTRLEPDGLPDADVWVAGPPCFPAGTPVFTSAGRKAIETVKTGDLVLSHAGRYRPVQQTMQRDYAGPMIILNFGYGMAPLSCTPEHPIWVRRRLVIQGPGKSKRVVYAEPEWLPAREIRATDLVLQPTVREPLPAALPPVLVRKNQYRSIVRSNRFFLNDLAFSEMLGWYVAEGAIHEKRNATKRGVTLHVNPNKAAHLLPLLDGLGLRASPAHERTVVKAHLTNIDVADACALFGRGAQNKQIPEVVFSLSSAARAAFLSGYWAGDGCRSYNPRVKQWTQSATTVSPTLAWGLARLIGATQNIIASISTLYKEGQAVIEDREVHVRTAYRVRSIIPHAGVAWKRGRVDASGVWRHVLSTSATPPLATTVYNLEVEEDHSYVVGDGVAVHNCQPFSTAGKRAGSHDPRDMWPHVLRLLEAKRPPFAVFENVTGLLNWNHGAYLRSIEDRLRAAGYAVTRAVLDAADFGVPQRRKRIFLLCRLGGPPIEPPWPTHGNPKRLAERSMFDLAPRRPWVTVRQALGIGGLRTTGRLDRPAPVVTTMEGRQLSPTDYARVRKAGALLGGLSPDNEARIIAHRNAIRTGHGSGATADEPSVTVAANPPRLRLASKRPRSSASMDAPSITIAADGRETFVRDAPAPTLAGWGLGRGGVHVDGGSGARRAWITLGIDPSSILDDLDEPSGTLRAGTLGQSGWSPRHRAGYVVDTDGPAPTLVMGGGATEATPGGGGVHQWAIAAAGDAPDTGDDTAGGSAPLGSAAEMDRGDDASGAADAPAQTVDSSGEWHRAGAHRPGEPSRGPRSRTILRRLTIHECARLQAFPDWVCFSGSKSAAYQQIGNAVPPLLAWHVANAVRAAMGLPAVPVPDVLAWYAQKEARHL